MKPNNINKIIKKAKAVASEKRIVSVRESECIIFLKERNTPRDRYYRYKDIVEKLFRWLEHTGELTEMRSRLTDQQILGLYSGEREFKDFKLI